MNDGWSYTKHLIFTQCPRKFFYYYFGAENGWQKDLVDDNHRSVYILKQIVTVDCWVKKLFNESLNAAFYYSNKANSEDFIQEITNQTFKGFSRDKKIILNQKYEDKPILIYEHFYDNVPHETIFGNAQDKLSALLRLFINSKICQNLSTIPIQSRKFLKSPIQFNLVNTKILSSINLFYQSQGKFYVVNTNVTLADDFLETWKYTSALSTLAVLYNNKLSLATIETVNLFINLEKSSCYNVYTKYNLRETCTLALESHRKIQSMRNINGKAYIENYPKTTNNSYCKKCIFRKLCFG